MNNCARSASASFGIITWLIVFISNATTFVPPTFEEMVDQAELVFVGKAVASRSEWRTVGPNRVIFTVAEFEAENVMKVNAEQSILS